MGPFDLTDLLLTAVIFTPLQWLLPMRRGQKFFRKGIGTDFCHVFISGVMIKLGIIAAIAPVFLAAKTLPLSGLHALVAAQPVWAQFAEALIIADLGYYAAHRAFHAVPALWRFHTIHHSIEEMDWVAAHRVHPVDQIATKFLSLAPLIVVGFSTDALLAFGLFYKWQSLLKHANVNIGFGPLRWVLVSPAFHHWHHANEAAAIDRNFAGQLSFIDLMFGTAHFPKSETPRRYGIDEATPAHYADQLLHPFKTMPRRAGAQTVLPAE